MSTDQQQVRIANLDTRQVLIGLVSLCSLFLVSDLMYVFTESHHPHIKYEGWFGFFGFFAFGATTCLVALAKLKCIFLGRERSYYDE